MIFATCVVMARTRNCYFIVAAASIIFVSLACRKTPGTDDEAKYRRGDSQSMPTQLSKISNLKEAAILAGIPKEIDNIVLQTDSNASRQPLTIEGFHHLLSTAKPLAIRDSFEDDWSYAPWYRGGFRSAQDTFTFQLFLGGRGKLVSSSGEWCLFSFDVNAGNPVNDSGTH